MILDTSSPLVVMVIVLLIIDIIFSFVNIKLRSLAKSIGKIAIELKVHNGNDENK